jgi:peptide/nickel transport system permease protein
VARLAARCGEVGFSLVLLVSVTFVLAHAVAGGPVYAMLGLRARAQSVAALNALLGLDQPLWRQYLLWWWHLLHGELGVSDLTNLPVAGLIATYAGQTLVLYTLGTLLALAFAAAVGLVHGVFYRSWPGRACSALEIVLYSLPGFFVATLLAMVFSAWLHVLPAGGMVDLRLVAPGLADRLRHVILPAASLMLVASPALARLLAQDVHRELASDYVRTARARGLRFGAILFRHVLPNAVRPVVTLLGYSLPAIFAGNVVIETVFDYPGLGWLMSHSARTQDYPVLLGIVLLVGVATMLGNFLADALNAALDPSME